MMRTSKQPLASLERKRLKRMPRLRCGWFALAGLTVSALGLAVAASQRLPTLSVSGYEVVKEYPHDNKAFCQGLAFEDGVLYEGTGLNGASTLRKVDLETGKVLQIVSLDRRLFGEGITIWGDRIIQLTWLSGVGIVYDRETFAEKKRFTYDGKGWGLTHDDKHLIMSDGTPDLRFLDPETFSVVKRLTVRANGRPVFFLNELEYISGEIFANVLSQDVVVRISPKTGEVTGLIDFRGLLPKKDRPGAEDMLNGIAYDTKGARLFVTGKNWPKLFEVRLVPKE